MKSLYAIVALLGATIFPVQQAYGLDATDVTASDIAAALAQLPKTQTSDQAIRVVDVGGYNVGIFGVFRPGSAPEGGILHESKMTEIYYIVAGDGTLVTGGKLREPVTRTKARDAETMNVRSDSGVDGGVSRHVGKGDFVIIPGGVPHWWARRNGDLSYLVIRTDPAKELAPK